MRALRSHALTGIAFTLVAVVTSASTTGCGCDANADPSIVVTIVDAKTGEPAAAGATVIVVGASFSDSVTFGPTEERKYTAFKIEAREGAYAITVRKDGYQTWGRAAFVREVGVCDRPQTLRLTAALIPKP